MRERAYRENDIDKISNTIISPFLSHTVNSCIQLGEFPNFLKIAEVPVFKKGDSNLLTNYRPISILSRSVKFLKNLYTIESTII